MYNTLKITSPNNPDWNGTWFKGEVEQEMREVGCAVSDDTSWIQWIMDHAIGGWNSEYDGDLEKAVINDHVTKICFKFTDGDVTVVKC